MKTTITASLAALTTTLAFLGAAACSGDPAPGPATGGTPGTGGASSGGASTGGAGGATMGGATSGGATSGGASTGGAAGAGTSGGGGGGGAGGAAGAPGTFAQVGKILQDNCGISCHAAGTDQVTLTNSDPTALYMRITTPLQTNVCSGVTMVVPNLALTSLLTRAIKGPVNDAGCLIPRMPNGCTPGLTCLKDAEIATIQSWIAAGAKP